MGILSAITRGAAPVALPANSQGTQTPAVTAAAQAGTEAAGQTVLIPPPLAPASAEAALLAGRQMPDQDGFSDKDEPPKGPPPARVPLAGYEVESVLLDPDQVLEAEAPFMPDSAEGGENPAIADEEPATVLGGSDGVEDATNSAPVLTLAANPANGATDATSPWDAALRVIRP